MKVEPAPQLTAGRERQEVIKVMRGHGRLLIDLLFHEVLERA